VAFSYVLGKIFYNDYMVIVSVILVNVKRGEMEYAMRESGPRS